jgi:uncharacterized protein YdeI (YjbR/CyaY-like superfamily)
VDSLVKRLDERRYALNRGDGPRPPRYKLPAKVPAYIEEALRKHPAAWRHFEALAPSQRRRYLGWIETAKQETTKARRLQEAIRLLKAGKELRLK